MSIIPNVFISPYGVLNTYPLPEDSISLPRILRVNTPPPPPNPPSLKSSKGPVFSDAHFNNPYPRSPGGGLFGHRNKQHYFKSKGLRKCQPIIVKPLTIRSPQAYTIPHLILLPGGTYTPTIDISQDTGHGLTVFCKNTTNKLFGWMGRENKTSFTLLNNHDQTFPKGRSLARVSCQLDPCWS